MVKLIYFFGVLTIISSAVATEVPMQISTSQFGPMASLGAGLIYVPCQFDSENENCVEVRI